MPTWRISTIAALCLALGVVTTAFADDTVAAGASGGADATAGAGTDATTDTTAAVDQGAAQDAQDAGEDEDKMPIRYSQRGLTMPAGYIRASWNLGIAKIVPLANVDPIVAMGLGIAISPVENLELGLNGYRMGSPPQTGGALNLLLSPSSKVTDIPAYVRYRLANGDTELAIEVAFLLPIDTDFGLTLSLPIRRHKSKGFATDIVPTLVIQDLGGTNLMAARLPFEFVVNLTKGLFTRLQFGFDVIDLTDQLGLGRTYNMAIGAGGGYSIGFGDHVLDLFGVFRLPALISVNPDRSGNEFDSETGIWEIIFGANMHLDLF